MQTFTKIIVETDLGDSEGGYNIDTMVASSFELLPQSFNWQTAEQWL